MSRTVVETVTIQGKSDGLKEVSADLNKVADAQDRVAASSKAAEVVTEKSSRSMASLEKANERVARSLDANYDRQIRYNQSLSVLNNGLEQGVLGASTYAQRMDLLQQKYGGMNDNIRLTSEQVRNLGFQLNDATTMLLSGASPFQIMATQGGQVVQALGDGPGGLKGSLAAIGSSIAGLARSIPGWGYAIAGVTAAVGALWYAASGPSARAAEETVRDFEGALKRLEAGWKGAAAAAKEYASAPTRMALDPNATFLDVQGSIKRLSADLRASINDLNSSDLLSGKIIRPFAGSVSDARREISSLYADLRQGEISAQAFGDAMLRIRLDPNADGYARNFAEEIRLAIGPVVELERQVQALNRAASQLAAPKGTMARNALPDEVFTERFGPAIGGDGRFGDSAAMDAIRDGLKSQREELTKTTEATRTYADAVADQKAGLTASVDQLRLQADMFGQSEGAIAAARFELDAMTAAQRAANEAKAGAIDPALIDTIKAQAAEYGRLTDQLAASTAAQREQQKAAEEAKRQAQRVADFEGDLAFERTLIGLSNAEQQIRSSLRNLGVDYNSFDGQRLAGEMRYQDALRQNEDYYRRAQEQLAQLGQVGQDAFMGIFDALMQGGDILDNVTGAMAAVGGPIGRADQFFEKEAA